MKKRNLIMGIALALMVSLGATAYASTGSSQTLPQRLGLGRITSMRGYDSLIAVLKSKLGMSDTDISNARSNGKTLYEIAQEKGLTVEELKSALYEERVKSIDVAVGKGTITKEEGETLKENLKININSCTGNFGQGQRTGRGSGMTGNGQRYTGCPYYNSIK